MDIHSDTSVNQKLVAEFCESEFATKSRGFLIPYAAHVVFIARMSKSTRLTAAFMTKKFGQKFSRRPIQTILDKVKQGEIVVTAEQLAEVAAEHPAAQHYATLYPDILNPTSRIEIEDVPAPKKVAASKKSKAVVALKKSTTPGNTTTSEVEKSPENHKQIALIPSQTGGNLEAARTGELTQEERDKVCALLDADDEEEEEFYR